MNKLMMSAMMLLAIAAGARAEGGMSLLEVVEDQKAKSVAVSNILTDSGAVEPGNQALQYEWKRGTADVEAGLYFDPAADTPAITNPRIAGGDGVCVGYNLLITRWFKKITLPALDQGVRHAIYGSTDPVPDVSIGNGLKVLGPIDGTNIAENRLFRWSSDDEVRDRLARAVGHLQLMNSSVGQLTEWAAGLVGIDRTNPTMHDNPVKTDWGLVPRQSSAFTRQVRTDVVTRSRELAMIDIQLHDDQKNTEGGHSLLVYRVESGTAGPVGQADGEKDALRLVFIDPNIPDWSRKNLPYLLYFPDENRYAIDPRYAAIYKGCGKSFPGDGTYFAGFLRHRPVHDAGAERAIEAHVEDRSSYIPQSASVEFIPESKIL